MKNVCLALALAGVLVFPQFCRAQFADTVISYNPGAGFAAGYTNASAALGAPASGSSVTPFSPPFSTSQIVSIGAGGQITLQLDTPILNDPSAPFGINFILFANEFFVKNSSGAVSGIFDHAASTLVQVSPDGSTWFTLNPSLAPPVGVFFPTDGFGNPQFPVDPTLGLSDFAGQNLAGIRSLYNGSAGGTGYELAWAQDTNGNSVDLSSADYVRLEVQSGVVDLDAVAVTPEPQVWTFGLAGVALLLLARQRKTRPHPIPLPQERGHQRRSLENLCAPATASAVWTFGAATLENQTRPSRRLGASVPPSPGGEGRREGETSSHRHSNPQQSPAVATRDVPSSTNSALNQIMKAKTILTTFLLLTSASLACAATFTENFSTDPAQSGWRVFGDTNLFHWNATNQNLEVTWDSSQSNSYFYHPLGNILALGDAFSLEFDLQLSHAQATNFFELAVGLLNFGDATNSTFSRDTADSPNLFEFDYFPDGGFGPSLDATLADSTVTATNTSDFYFAYEDVPLAMGVTYHIVLTHLANDPAISGTVLTNGQIYSSLPNAFAGPIVDFRLDTFSVSSYIADGGFGDSVLASGTVDNIVVNLPQPPVRNLGGALTNGVWQTQFIGRTNWLYTLARTTDFSTWTDAGPVTPGLDGPMVLFDTNAPVGGAFYRVRAAKP